MKGIFNIKKAGALLLLAGSVFSFSCSREDDKEAALYQEITDDLEGNILPFWKKQAADPAGGFYGALAYDGSPVANADKGCVLNARILWTFSAAARLPGDDGSLRLANRAQRYFIDHFIDPEQGGAYWSLLADGTPKDTDKQTYGIAFAIYGLSEHFRATQNRESLDQAIGLYRCLEDHAFDPEYGGYIESFTRDWQKPERYGYDGAGVAVKTMNTHIHVLEAYTNLYRAWKDEGLHRQLKALTEVLINRIYNPKTRHQMLFFSREWQSLEDIDSYGHDIETSWLLTEAAELLGDAELMSRTKKIAIDLVDTQMKEGMKPDGSLIYERHGDHYRRDLSWWCQAESVNGLLNAWRISGDGKYLEAAVRTWEWIRNNMIDREYGEWYGSVSEDGKADVHGLKASLWRCPYHNSRMGLEMIGMSGRRRSLIKTEHEDRKTQRREEVAGAPSCF